MNIKINQYDQLSISDVEIIDFVIKNKPHDIETVTYYARNRIQSCIDYYEKNKTITQSYLFDLFISLNSCRETILAEYRINRNDKNDKLTEEFMRLLAGKESIEMKIQEEKNRHDKIKQSNGTVILVDSFSEVNTVNR